MLLDRSDKLLAFSVAVFVAGIVGVTLGQSAIGAINPLYFQGVPEAPRAVDGRERPPGQPAYYQAYGWEQGAEARAIACGDNCGPPEPYATYAYVEAPVRLSVAGWREDTPPAELEPWPPGQVSADRDRAVVRYADFPIEAKPEAINGKDDMPADDQRADPPEE